MEHWWIIDDPWISLLDMLDIIIIIIVVVVHVKYVNENIWFIIMLTLLALPLDTTCQNTAMARQNHHDPKDAFCWAWRWNRVHTYHMQLSIITCWKKQIMLTMLYIYTIYFHVLYCTLYTVDYSTIDIYIYTYYILRLSKYSLKFVVLHHKPARRFQLFMGTWRI
jgi:hypothetical protein